MATYAIGDIQGCYAALEKLLQVIAFDAASDVLWSTGDLVNRGAQSLEVLRFFSRLGKQHRIVLGNHDLHLLAVAVGTRERHKNDTLDAILAAPDRNELIEWLRQLPLLVHDEALNYVMTHAGIAPMWNLAQAKSAAKEVESVLQGAQATTFFKEMYGSLPDYWRDDLHGNDRLRCIVNYFTRMRYCHADGRLDLTYKGSIAEKPAALTPWFEMPNRANTNENIIFGHWAALAGKANVPGVFPLDTGCVWGGCLSAMRLEDRMLFNVSC